MALKIFALPLASMNVRLKDKRVLFLPFQCGSTADPACAMAMNAIQEFPTTEGTPMHLTSVKGSWLPVKLAKLILCKAIHSTVGQPKWLKVFHYTELKYSIL